MSEIDDDDVMENSYEIDTKGLNFSYGIPLQENSRLNTKLEYATHKIKCGSGFSATGYEPSQCSISERDEVVLSVNLNENSLNDYMYPTEGQRNLLGVNLALPLGDYRYFDINANHTSYKPFSSDLTLKLTADLGLSLIHI